MSQDWVTIESDPAIFTEIISDIGVKGVQMKEFLDPDEAVAEDSLFGLIFLFKWVKREDDRKVLSQQDVPDLFYANQEIQNACATQAILSILMNISAENIEIGEALNDLKGFSAGLDYATRGIAIGQLDVVRIAHNKFAHPDTFFGSDTPDFGEKEAAHHFISYIPFNGRVYELDGLKGGPIDVGPAGSNWRATAVDEVRRRMGEQAASGDLSFNLMGAIADRLSALEKAISEVSSSSDSSSEENQLKLESLKEDLEKEKEIREQWRVENIRRRHDFVPFLMEVLKYLAKNKKLNPLLDAAKAKAEERARSKR